MFRKSSALNTAHTKKEGKSNSICTLNLIFIKRLTEHYLEGLIRSSSRFNANSFVELAEDYLTQYGYMKKPIRKIFNLKELN